MKEEIINKIKIREPNLKDVYHICGAGKMPSDIKWLMLTVILGILIAMYIPSSSAFLGTFKKGECVQLVTVLNSSYANISGITTPTPNPEILYQNAEMDNVANFFNYTFCNTTKLGIYTYGYIDDIGNVYSNDFEITPNGNQLSTSSGIIYFIILICLVLSFVFLLSKGFQSDMLGWQIGYSLIAYLVLLVSSFIAYQLAFNYLADTPFISDILNYVWIILGILAFPIFIFAIFGLLLSYAKELKNKKKNRFSS